MLRVVNKSIQPKKEPTRSTRLIVTGEGNKKEENDEQLIEY